MSVPLLTPFGPDVWIADGPTVSVIGFHYPTRMAIIRLADGELFVWSPVAHSEDLRRELDAIGVVHFIIAPNTLHDLSQALAECLPRSQTPRRSRFATAPS